jgi:group II intron reverse transcriptase/maturase
MLHAEGERHMETKLKRIAKVAKEQPEARFTSLIHLINSETIIMCHKEMSARKASGVDKVTKDSYGGNLEANVADLIGRMKRQVYKPQPARRVYIPKTGSDKMRPLGIPAYEDKLVQSALAKILNAIYEEDFLENSFGFRPGRSCHDALKILNIIVNKKNINYVVDTDIKGFFDNVDHEWMKKFIKHRIQDVNINRLIARMLKAGIVEAGIKYDTHEGTPQGGVASPIFANIYLHYVLDLWFEKVMKKTCKGKAYMVRYADDSVFCFQYKEDAYKFYEELIIRLKKFNLEISKEKTKIIKLEKDNNDDNSDGNSFDFLGFTHYCTESKKGYKYIARKTSKKKYNASLLRCKEWMKYNRILPTKEFMKKIIVKIIGHCNYYAVTGNSRMIGNFIDECRTLIYKWLNRRSQKSSFNWDKFVLFLKKYPLPKARVKVNIFDVKVGISYLCE